MRCLKGDETFHHQRHAESASENLRDVKVCDSDHSDVGQKIEVFVILVFAAFALT